MTTSNLIFLTDTHVRARRAARVHWSILVSMPDHHAFVLTSSPTNSSYEVGVMKALLRGNWGVANYGPVDPYCYSGSSVGAFNAAVMVGGSDGPVADTLEKLERIWVDRIASDRPGTPNGILRIRGVPSRILDSTEFASDPLRSMSELGGDMLHLASEFLKRSAYAASGARTLPDRIAQAAVLSPLIDVSPLRELIADSIQPKSIRHAAKELRITALDWDRGRPRTFANKDIGDNEVLLGAMSLAVLMEPVQVDGASYLDASVIHDKPLQPAIDAAPASDAGDKLVLHMVYDDAETSPVRPEPLDNTLSTLFRLFLFAISRSVNADIARAAGINDRLSLNELLVKLANRDSKTMDQVLATLGPAAVNVWTDLTQDLRGKRKVTVHRFRASEIRGFNLHHLERRRIQRLIDDGYEDALRHDCEKCDCVHPDKPKRRPTR